VKGTSKQLQHPISNTNKESSFILLHPPFSHHNNLLFTPFVWVSQQEIGGVPNSASEKYCLVTFVTIESKVV